MNVVIVNEESFDTEVLVYTKDVPMDNGKL